MAAPMRSSWGWHCLSDEWAEEIVASAGDLKGRLVLDIGAGTGALTRPLVERGARVIAVELHPDRVARLRRRFDKNDVTVVRADAADLRLPRQPFVVVSNPPFSITTPLLKRLLHPASRLDYAIVVLELSAARSWAAGRGRGADGWASRFDIRVSGRLPRKAFHPRPHVDVAVLTITRVLQWRGDRGTSARRSNRPPHR